MNIPHPVALSEQKVAEALINGVNYAVFNAVQGDIAEFGTSAGLTTQIIAQALQPLLAGESVRANKSLHLFDSFEGLPEPLKDSPDADNDLVRMGFWGRGKCLGLSAAQLRQKIQAYLPDGRILIYPGWFKDMFKNVPAATRFSMVHIDCDYYQSALEVLEFLFSERRLSPGAMLFFDDWDCHHASNEHGERRAFDEVVQKYAPTLEDYGAYGHACHRFILQKY